MSDLVGGGPILIVAPHPDDETIGCGGLICLAVEAGIDVRIVIMTDGSLSHPNSRLFAPERLAALRKRECLAACDVLGVTADKVIFRDAKDGSLQSSDREVQWMRTLLRALRPTAAFTTWTDDPHGDHKAAFKIVRTASLGAGIATRIFAYPIWSRRIVHTRSPLDAAVFRLDTMSVIGPKMQAFACHRSQLGKVVLDDPGGCTFTERDLAVMRRLNETFISVFVQSSYGNADSVA